jgi:hypothetical protein
VISAVNVAIFVFDADASPTPAIVAVPIPIPKMVTPIPVTMVAITTITVASLSAIIPFTEGPFAITIALATIAHAFVIPLALLLLLAALRGLPSWGLGEADRQSTNKKCRGHQ